MEVPPVWAATGKEHAMNRNGKIARLPRWIREELNGRLQRGQQGDSLLAELNRQPEVRKGVNP